MSQYIKVSDCSTATLGSGLPRLPCHLTKTAAWSITDRAQVQSSLSLPDKTPVQRLSNSVQPRSLARPFKLLSLNSSNHSTILFLSRWWTRGWSVNWITASRWLVGTLRLLKLNTSLLSSKIALVAVAIVRLVWLGLVRWSGSVGGVAVVRLSSRIGRRAMARRSPSKPSGATIWCLASSATATSSYTASIPMSVFLPGYASESLELLTRR